MHFEFKKSFYDILLTFWILFDTECRWVIFFSVRVALMKLPSYTTKCKRTGDSFVYLVGIIGGHSLWKCPAIKPGAENHTVVTSLVAWNPWWSFTFSVGFFYPVYWWLKWIHSFLLLFYRPSEAGLGAVLSNNLVTINKDQNVFDSKRKMKSATGDGVKNKLTSAQKQTIAVNQCLLHMYSNQVTRIF